MLSYIRGVKLKNDETGASAVEYGLLVAAIAAVIVIVIFALGSVINKSFTKTCNSIGSKGTNSQTTKTASCS